MKKIYSKIKTTINLLVGLCFLNSVELNGQAPVSQTFAFTGSLQTFTVPSGVSSISITAAGAQGIGANGFLPGNGGLAFGVLTVTPGQILNIYVGGSNAFNGGGIGQGGANGGGASDVRVGGTALANRVIVAGGGGGAGGDNWICLTGSGHGGGGTAVGTNFVGGAGGAGYSSGTGCGTNGGNLGGSGGSGTHGGGGGGGGLTSGGAGAASSIGTAGVGSLGQGGASYNSASCGATGGGGGGYYGGGGAAGNNCGAGRGGGGSSWTGTLSSPSFTAGGRAGNGQVAITYSVNANGGAGGPLSGAASNYTFNYTGSTQSFTVPSCVNSITFDVRGASGGFGSPAVSSGGNGGRVVGIMTVTPGQVLQINVGGTGAPGSVSSPAAGGFNGGGAGAFYSGSYAGGGGGGASDIRVTPYALADRMVVAGGGGGGAYNSGTSNYDRGGYGGGTTGQAGLSGNVSGGTAPGGGGSPTSGGTGGFWSGYCTAFAGALGSGGSGCTSSGNSGGGGGGGYYGGGGGVWAGGGGGSNYANPSLTSVTHYQGTELTGVVMFTLSTTGTSASVVATPSAVCLGGTVSLNATGVSSYTWSSASGIISNNANVVVTPSTGATYSIIGTNTSGCVSGYSISVGINSLPTITVNSGTICAGSVFTIVPSGASTYTFSGGTNTVSPGANNVYTVNGTNVAGCTASVASVSSVTVIALPIVSAPSGTMCANSNYTINASGASTYTYSSGSNIVSPANTSTYTVSGTSINGCISIPVVTTVSVSPLPTIIVNSGAICTGNVFTITPSGAAVYSLNTGPTGTSFTVSPLVNTNYLVSGTSSVGCLSSSSALSQITVNVSPTITATSGTLCTGNTFSIIANGASTYTYSGGSSAVNPLVTTSYSVTGTSSLGCVGSNTAVANVTVYVTPTVGVNSGQICLGQTFTLTGIGASSYNYSGGSSTVSPTSNTSYSVTGTSAQGCVSNNTAISNVTVNPIPVIVVNSGTLCSGSSFTIVPSGAFTYTVSGGSTVVSPTVNSLFFVTGTSAMGCVGTNTAISSLTVFAPPTISVNSGTVCSGSSFTILPSGASTYTFGGGSNVVNPTTSTNYTVVGSDALGCVSNIVTSTLTVNNLPQVLASVSNSLICDGETATITASGASTYSWSSGPVTSVIVVNPTSFTTYTVNGKSTEGCSATAVVSLSVNACTAINALNKNNSNIITVFPNPNSGVFSLSINGTNLENAHYEVYSYLGQKVLSSAVTSEVNTVNLSEWSNGVYVIKLISNEQVITSKLIIKQ